MATFTRKPIGLSEKEYLASGAWKCPESPTGAHWWNCNVEPSICKICGKGQITVASAASTLLP